MMPSWGVSFRTLLPGLCALLQLSELVYVLPPHIQLRAGMVMSVKHHGCIFFSFQVMPFGVISHFLKIFIKVFLFFCFFFFDSFFFVFFLKIKVSG